MEPLIPPAARIIFGEKETPLYPGQACWFGRSAENDVVLDDPKISRSHAVLEWNGTGFSLRDLDSINGTYVNGERLQNASRQLRDGDAFRLHTFQFQYFIERMPAEQSGSAVKSRLRRPDRQLGPRLLVIAGPDQGQEYPLWGEQITLGRASLGASSRGSSGELPVTWEIRLTDKAVSRPHARLERHGTQIYLLDLDSANGTLLNGQPVTEPALLHDNDLIVVGETQLRLALR